MDMICERLDDVSIHAPVKVRPRQKKKQMNKKKVSIHAPVKVRLQNFLFLFWPVSFNSRTREGATAGFAFHIPKVLSFNSRTREGATQSGFKAVCITGVSIHAPVKVRHDKPLRPVIHILFQFTHP